MTSRTAKCACGQLRVACEGEPDLVSLCHCLECQRRTGSAFGVAAFFPRSHVRPEGRASTYTRTADSGYAITVSFCPDCGSSVYWEPLRKPGRSRWPSAPSPIRRFRRRRKPSGTNIATPG